MGKNDKAGKNNNNKRTIKIHHHFLLQFELIECETELVESTE